MMKAFYTAILVLIMCNMQITAWAAPVAGNANGKITLVEFYDYQCPHCQAMFPVLQNLMKQNPNLRVVYRPVAFLGDTSEMKARLALAANYTKQFMKTHWFLVEHSSDFSIKVLNQLAKLQHIAPQQLEKEMQSKVVSEELKQNTQLLSSLHVNVVPLILIGYTHASQFSYEFIGEQSEMTLQTAINHTHK